MFLKSIMTDTNVIPSGTPEIVNLFAYAPKVALPLRKLSQEVMRGEGPLTFGQRELIAALTSKVNGCMFCMSTHTIAALELYGLSANRVLSGYNLDMNTASDWYGLTDREIGFLLLVKASQATVDVERREAIVDHVKQRLSEAEIFQASTIIALFNFFNHWVLLNGVKEMSPAEYQASGKRIATEGYV